ncbi:3-phytase [Streptoalloteichus tenebrarius]|uniref:3-phytase n=1 Tax=Streptoalloteichus tenebrarius (strain ATCC 17920 / DSM 40477 / JCM 4838 / CBS 697.72 / NBRC 16177 / NCIMB 11028 / NRRL B-12390 / A12253. 1 / ISP 5477) TaxID=1933 RepID=A0ABT1I0X3_STRSD|nr:phytase [Streptoalloteichus tenebrarius]MCP2261383.1 3-phytase [Streptoalloteichus tenebrarius]BFF00925.1 hypothetical protein GCM10020241_26000 [Streptoalloteichus tenebrarius]
MTPSPRPVLAAVLAAAVFATLPGTAHAAPVEVSPTVETTPVAHSGDAADDPAVWVHPTDPARSLVIGTDKDGALETYDLSGARVQRITGTKPNNVDLRGDLVVTADDDVPSDGRMRFYRVDPATRQLTDVGALNASVDEHGICAYRSARSGRTYVFANDVTGRVEQWEVSLDATGKVTGHRVRGPWDVGGTVEGCVADDQRGVFYLAEETGGVWAYGAEPDASTTARREIDRAGAGHLTADVEGLALAGDRLLVSSQGDDSYAAYDVTTGAFVAKFQVTSNTTVDGCSHTDGIEASTANLGPRFPHGLFICQDDKNTKPGVSGNQNFKLVPLDRLPLHS